MQRFIFDTISASVVMRQGIALLNQQALPMLIVLDSLSILIKACIISAILNVDSLAILNA